jgi:hypothetical protein
MANSDYFQSAPAQAPSPVARSSDLAGAVLYAALGGLIASTLIYVGPVALLWFWAHAMLVKLRICPQPGSKSGSSERYRNESSDTGN